MVCPPFLLKAVVNLRLKGLTGENVPHDVAVRAASRGGDLARALELAVKWDRPSVAKEILDALGSMRTAFPNGAGSTPAVRAALQLAIEKARVGFVDVLLKQPGERRGDAPPTPILARAMPSHPAAQAAG